MEASMQSLGSIRSLPPNDPAVVQKLTSSTIEDHYVAFILYCNPSLDATSSTTELRRGFRSVPRSDGKSFETLTVFDLVGKMERGEITTWIQLVTELGVEPPNLKAGGSGQKLQQYAVRLKRWAHAHHIDAFFQYLLGNHHSYFTQLPPEHDTVLSTRDGVPPSDDLALRAMRPDLRPKRGRRKGYDDDDESVDTPSKRLRAGTPSTVDGRNSPRPDLFGRVSQSPAPYMGHFLPGQSTTQQTPVYPHDEHLSRMFANADRAFGNREGLNQAPPSAIQATTPQLQAMNPWPTPSGRSENDYPHSAIDLHPPTNGFGSPDLNDGSRSAHPISVGRSSKSKRRGAAGVSAVWNTSADNESASGPRPRGRPVGSRKTKNGSFEIWSVKESIEIDRSAQKANSFYPQIVKLNRTQAAVAPMHHADPVPVAIVDTPQVRGTPTKKLSLKVPHQPGGNVRLATPPNIREQAKAAAAEQLPQVTLNDEGALSRARSSLSKTRERDSLIERERQRERLYPDERAVQRRSSAEFFNIIDEEASMPHPHDDYDIYNKLDMFDDDTRNDTAIDWRQRAMILARKLKQTQDELQRVKKAVLEVVMSTTL